MPNARVVQILDRMDGTDGVREKATARRVARTVAAPMSDVSSNAARSRAPDAQKRMARSSNGSTGVPSAETAA